MCSQLQVTVSISKFQDQVFNQTLAEIKSFDRNAYQRLERDHSKKFEIMKLIQAQIQADSKAESQLLGKANEFETSVCDTLNDKDLAAKLDLSDEDAKRIKDGLKMRTFVVKIHDDASARLSMRKVSLSFCDDPQSGEVYDIQWHHRDRRLHSPHERQLDRSENIEWAYFTQVSSIIIEGIFLVLSIVGQVKSVSTAVKRKAYDELVAELSASSSFRKAVEAFLEAWPKDEADIASSFYAKAKALFNFMYETHALGILWPIIRTLFSDSEKSWWDWIKAAALITAQLIAAFSTKGIAFIAKFVLALKNGHDFLQKIVNLRKLVPQWYVGGGTTETT